MAAEAPVRTKQAITDKEWSLIQELRNYQFAEIRVEMKNGQPHRTIGGVKSVML